MVVIVVIIAVAARLVVWAISFVPVRGDSVSAVKELSSLQYGVSGPFSVGAKDLKTKGLGPIEVTLWYPAKAGNGATRNAYPFGIKMLSPTHNVNIATVAGSATWNAEYERAAAPYPLVFLSPGFGMGRKVYGWIAEHLASYGFIVIALEHKELLDPSELWKSLVDRPRDIMDVFSFVERQASEDSALQGLVDLNTLAVIGHSFGGYAALAAAGSRLDFAGFERICQRIDEEDDSLTFLCEALLPNVTKIADYAGLDSVPAGLWPDWGDMRVDAIVSFAGDAAMFGADGLAAVTAPVLAIGGTEDLDSPYQWGTGLTHENVSSSRKIAIALTGASHMIFAGSFDFTRRMIKLVPNGFFQDKELDKEAAQVAVRHITTTFLLTELKEDAEARGILASDKSYENISIESIGYQLP
jgi:predicted dienelactone hydrolase